MGEFTLSPHAPPYTFINWAQCLSSAEFCGHADQSLFSDKQLRSNQARPPCFVFQKLHSNLGVVSPLSSRWPVLHLGMKMSLSFLSWPEVGVPSFLSIRKFFPQCNSPRETLSSCKLKCLCRKPTYISIPYTTGWPNALLDASFKTMEKA